MKTPQVVFAATPSSESIDKANKMIEADRQLQQEYIEKWGKPVAQILGELANITNATAFITQHVAPLPDPLPEQFASSTAEIIRAISLDKGIPVKELEEALFRIARGRAFRARTEH